jgi:chemotaxis protein CheY-P-specific phosphatase CheC
MPSMKNISTKESTLSFVKNVMDRKYSKASEDLSDVINKKIQQRIINNNIRVF